jgi:hypothetical protein
LSLRLFTLVPNHNGGFSAILRFRVPVVVLHSWRGHAVRQTMIVVVTPPSGGARAVQLQADGTAMNGTSVAGMFTPTDTGRAVIAGNVVVFDIPPAFGATSDWTVQAIVRVQADEPLHPNRPATGYAAGTSVVPIGLLTGAAAPAAGWGVVDATTALTSASTAPAGTGGLRPRAIRLEGSGKTAAAVVTLDDSPTRVAASENPHLDLELAPSAFATLEHPVRVTWLPNGSEPVTSAQVSVDTTVIGDVPMSVSGNDVRFALGAYTPRSSVAQPPTPRLDNMQYQVTVPLGRLETVSSIDGITGPKPNPTNADLTVNGNTVTITPMSTGVAAQGLIDPAGRFVATNETDYYTGSVDAAGNVVIFDTTVTGIGGGGRSVRRLLSAGRPIPITQDWTGDDDVLGHFVDQALMATDEDIFKNAAGPLSIILGSPEPLQSTLADPGNLNWTASPTTPSPVNAAAFDTTADGPAQPAGAQGGNPDFPATPTVDASSTGGTSGAIAVRVTGGTTPSGNPIDVTTPWTVSNLLIGPAAAGRTPSGITSTASKSGSPAGAITAVVAAVAVIGGGGLLVTRRRRNRAASRL